MNKICYAIIIAFSFIGSFLHAQQNIKKFVKENTVKVQNINPYTSDYKDLEAIGNAIGDSKIVMLGEQDHGDAPAFLAKTKIIKYLHEVKGFNVLAFESDFFALNEGWEHTDKTKTEIDSFLRGNIFPIWTACDACQQLFQYIPETYKTPQPLHITGFDNQVFLNHSYTLLSKKMDSVLRSYELPITKTAEYKTEAIPYIDSLTNWYKPYVDTSQYGRTDVYLRQMKKELHSKLNESNFWMKTLDNLLAVNLQFWRFKTPFSYEARDGQMADNIAWLSRVKYPNEKIIVWAHNYHISKQDINLKEKWYGKTSMGGFMSRDTVLIAQTYVLGFTSYEGTAGRIGNKIYATSHKKNSLESWVDKKFNYGFIDLLPYPGNHDQKFIMKGDGHYHSNEAWMRKYDGFFFIRTMYPCMNIKER